VKRYFTCGKMGLKLGFEISHTLMLPHNNRCPGFSIWGKEARA
jgi:hypothetical protein